MTVRKDYVECGTDPSLPPHMRIGSNYAIRGGQAASRIAELEARVQELSSQAERSGQTVYLRTKLSLSSDTFFLLELDVIIMLGCRQLEDMTARAAQLQKELATVTATSAEQKRALQAEVAELKRDLDTLILSGSATLL